MACGAGGYVQTVIVAMNVLTQGQSLHLPVPRSEFGGGLEGCEQCALILPVGWQGMVHAPI